MIFASSPVEVLNPIFVNFPSEKEDLLKPDLNDAENADSNTAFIKR